MADSPGLSGIFLVAINGSAAAELRIGYFGETSIPTYKGRGER